MTGGTGGEPENRMALFESLERKFAAKSKNSLGRSGQTESSERATSSRTKSLKASARSCRGKIKKFPDRGRKKGTDDIARWAAEF